MGLLDPIEFFRNDAGVFRGEATGLSTPAASAVCADFDNDGQHDVAYLSDPGLSGTGSVTIVFGDGNCGFTRGSAGPYAVLAGQNGYSRIVPGDIDSDGDLDILTGDGSLFINQLPSPARERSIRVRVVGGAGATRSAVAAHIKVTPSSERGFSQPQLLGYAQVLSAVTGVQTDDLLHFGGIARTRRVDVSVKFLRQATPADVVYRKCLPSVDSFFQESNSSLVSCIRAPQKLQLTGNSMNFTADMAHTLDIDSVWGGGVSRPAPNEDVRLKLELISGPSALDIHVLHPANASWTLLPIGGSVAFDTPLGQVRSSISLFACLSSGAGAAATVRLTLSDDSSYFGGPDAVSQKIATTTPLFISAASVAGPCTPSSTTAFAGTTTATTSSGNLATTTGISASNVAPPSGSDGQSSFPLVLVLGIATGALVLVCVAVAVFVVRKRAEAGRQGGSESTGVELHGDLGAAENTVNYHAVTTVTDAEDANYQTVSASADNYQATVSGEQNYQTAAVVAEEEEVIYNTMS
jgi:FG-GAP-like repeat